eukprot:jgi/Orpsp1_1/1191245/evm.model.d7180000084357.1
MNSEPKISNKDEILKIEGHRAFSSNPTELIADENNKKIDILSGDVLSDDIRFYVIDDYNNVINFETDISDVNDLFVFEIGTNDEKNIALFGQKNGFCRKDSCIASNIRVVGNPGVYYLYLKLITFGRYAKFKDYIAYFEVNISECNSSYIYQDKDNINLKSCYKPYCELSCSPGVCVNDNVCDCTETNFKGQFCNERYSLERIKLLDILLKIISIIFILFTIILIFGIIVYRKNSIIKAGSVDFLIIILFGALLVFIYSIFLSIPRTKKTCIIIILFENIGYSLIYSSILIKTFRIYR